MNKNRLLCSVVGFILLSLWAGTGNTAEESDRWTLYGTSEMGDSYYDKGSITAVNPDVFQVWNKDRYSKAGREEIIQGRRNYGLSMDGYDRLDYATDIIELDCINRTMKDIMFVEYNHEDKILFEYDFPTPKIRHVLPGTSAETLLKIVCPK